MSLYIKTHTVEKGETLEDIVSRYNIPDLEMLRYFHNQNVPKNSNHIGSVVFAGQEIFIPEKQDIEKIIADRKIRVTEFLDKEQDKRFNQNLKFPFISGNYSYIATLQEEGDNEVDSFIVQIEWIKTLDELHYLNITQGEIKTNEDIPNSIELLASEINKNIYPMSIFVNEKGLIQKADKIHSLRQNWNIKKPDLYEFFPKELGAEMLTKTGEKLSNSEDLGFIFNLNPLWALLFRGITGKYENGKCEKKINFIDGHSRFSVINRMIKKDTESLKNTYDIEQKIYEEDTPEEIKAEVLYKLDMKNILQYAKISFYDMPEHLNLTITKTQ
ncbi:hypothetical protein ACM39_11510 [Chryseobacterium sp. FH2]|uniref:LysM peptidoglycan-binding domain-containing protein n=1 Tax=Chryseobacterium sp. FH2 TaxID=1674291 RepID=UPI00065AC256|nr:LysM domain-containing protein [Chryseobacterium sp. FH2]KMQ67953.1 hypothetical protein ACM39_11510 [Chryseobacterium sp. FH2]